MGLLMTLCSDKLMYELGAPKSKRKIKASEWWLPDAPAYPIPHPQICLAFENLRAPEGTYFNTLSLYINVLVTLHLHCHLSSRLRNKHPRSFPWFLLPVCLLVSPTNLPTIILHQSSPLCSFLQSFLTYPFLPPFL